MADLEFVIEAPQVTRTNKKRPRLVTSCDHWCVSPLSHGEGKARVNPLWVLSSRVKKIKCVQQPATGKCEACLAANLPCLYRDREQYFAERTRMLSGAGSALRDASTNAQSRAHLSAINASSPAPSRGPSPPHSTHSNGSASDRSSSPSYFSFMGVDSVESMSVPAFNSGLNAPAALPTWYAALSIVLCHRITRMLTNASRDGPIQPLSWAPRRPVLDVHTGMDFSLIDPTSDVTPLLGLFDAHDSTQPHPNLMMSFLHVFFEKLGSTYPFLSSEIVCDRFLHRQLSPLLANAIAASAARYAPTFQVIQLRR